MKAGNVKGRIKKGPSNYTTTRERGKEDPPIKGQEKKKKGKKSTIWGHFKWAKKLSG